MSDELTNLADIVTGDIEGVAGEGEGQTGGVRRSRAVVSFRRDGDGLVMSEQCDQYFAVRLTVAQVHELIVWLMTQRAAMIADTSVRTA